MQSSWVEYGKETNVLMLFWEQDLADRLANRGVVRVFQPRDKIGHSAKITQSAA
jgi:hypothetical protein